MYGEGKGVHQDFTETARWFRLAAEQGFARAQFSLGAMYGSGTGVPQDDAEAVRLYRSAAEQGDAYAQLILGLVYLQGKGVVEDYVSAHMWLNIAASQGIDEARTSKEAIAKQMTVDDISKAQQLARECVARDFQDC